MHKRLCATVLGVLCLAVSATGQSVSLLERTALATAQVDVLVSPDDRFAMVRAGAAADAISFYRLTDGKQTAVFNATTGLPAGVFRSADSLAISGDGSRAVATGGASSDSVQIFDTSGATPVRMAQFPLFTASHDVVVSPDGRFAVVRAQASGDGVTFYSLANATRSGMFAAFTGTAAADSLAVSPDSSRVVALGGAGIGAISVFATSSSSPSLVGSLQTLTVPNDVAVSPDGRFAMVRTGASADGIVFVRLSNATALATFPTSTGPAGALTGLLASDSVEISADGRRAVALGGAGADSVVIFDVQGTTPQVVARHALTTAPHDLALSPDSRFAVVRSGAAADGVAFFDLASGNLIATFAASTAPANLLGLVTAPDSVVVSGDGDRTVVLGGASGDGVMTFDTSGAAPQLLASTPLFTAGDDLEASLTPRPGFAVVRAGAGIGGVTFLDLSSGGVITRFTTSTGAPADNSDSLAVSSDGRRVVAVGGAGSVEVFAVEQSKPQPFGAVERASLPEAGGEANDFSDQASMSSDGRTVAFRSTASNLVAGATPGVSHVYVRNLAGGAIEQVDVTDSGVSADGNSQDPEVSGDSRWVVFESRSTNLVAADANGAADIFVRDRLSGITRRVSVASDGSEANSFSLRPTISGEGRTVAFMSDATNLVAGDSNQRQDIFVHDLVTGTTERVNLGPGGAEADNGSSDPALSGDGRFVAFSSAADNLVPGDANGETDVYVADRQTGTIERVSVSSIGLEADGGSGGPSISADGRYVAFWSRAGNLVPGDTNQETDFFVHDRLTGTTRRVNVDSLGAQSDTEGVAVIGAISPDGRYTAFHALADDLAPADTNGVFDVFLHDLATGETSRVSISSSGAEADGFSGFPSPGLLGRSVAFTSSATNLVPGDTNGVGDVFVASRAAAGPDADADGVEDAVEAAAPGGGDGNGDGIPDSAQDRVASLPNVVDGRYLTVEAEPGLELAGVASTGYPFLAGAPPAPAFPAGFVELSLGGLGHGDATTVELRLPPGSAPTTYWKFGRTPGNPTPHWYEFLFDGTTGATISGDRVTLHLVDGMRGDGDLSANGTIVDPGGPAAPAGTGPGPQAECELTDTVACLNDARFRVTMTWATANGASGVGMAEPLTDDTAYFWFFAKTNVEVVLKVLDGCPVNDRFWVFAGGLTNVEVEIHVTDTATGASRTYRNPQKTAFQPLQDTGAFATCQP